MVRGEGAKYIETNQDHWETIFKIHQLKCLNKCTIPGWVGVGGFQKKGAQACGKLPQLHLILSLVWLKAAESFLLYTLNKRSLVLGKTFVL